MEVAEKGKLHSAEKAVESKLSDAAQTFPVLRISPLLGISLIIKSFQRKKEQLLPAILRGSSNLKNKGCNSRTL